MLDSPEYRRVRPDALSAEAVVRGAYEAILGRAPDANGLVQTLADLGAGRLDVVGLITALLASPEYGREHAGAALRGSKPVCTLIDGDLRLWIDLADRHVSHGCLAGDYEVSETRFVLSHLEAGDVFLDIGANVGWFAIQAADRVGATGRVHAFEPRAATRVLLERSMADNGFEDRMVLHPVALGARDGEARLLGHEDSTNLGGFRLERDATDAFPGMISETVTVAKLDTLQIAGPVRLIKLDVEGAEPLVLQGATALIARDRPLILMEVSAASLFHVADLGLAAFASMIEAMGYRIHALSDGEKGGQITDLAALDASHPFNVVLIPTGA